MENCIFCKIIKGEVPCYKVWEDDNFLAFPTIHPLKKGQIMVIPKKHQNYVFDLDDKTLQELVLRCKIVATAIKKAFNPKSGKVSMMTLGLSAPHVHVHLFPLDTESDINSENAYSATDEELKEVTEKIKSHF